MFDTESVRGSTHITFRKANKMHIHPTVIPRGVFHSWPKLYLVPSIIYQSTVRMYGHDLYYQSIDQPVKVVNPARGQLNREKNVFFPVPVRA